MDDPRPRSPGRPAALTRNDFQALSNFRYQVRRFLRFSEQLTAGAGITNLQYLLLLHVKGHCAHEWATITDLAERLQAKHHGVVALVTRCERLGLVERRPGRADGREVEIHLTRAGDRKVGELARLHRDELVRLEGLFALPGSGRPAPGMRKTAEQGR